MRYDGADVKTGLSRFRAVGAAEAYAHDRLLGARGVDAKGTTLAFKIAPAVTALDSSTGSGATLGETETLQALAGDFARSLSSLARVQADLKKLSQLGPLAVEQRDAATLAVRFPGCDGQTVERLCDELGIERGIVIEDEAWAVDDDGSENEQSGHGDRDVEMALLFPWAPTQAPSADEGVAGMFERKCGGTKAASNLSWRSMLSGGTPHASPPMEALPAGVEEQWADANPWSSESEGFDHLAESDWGSDREVTRSPPWTAGSTLRTGDASAYEGVEGIYRFLAECKVTERG